LAPLLGEPAASAVDGAAGLAAAVLTLGLDAGALAPGALVPGRAAPSGAGSGVAAAAAGGAAAAVTIQGCAAIAAASDSVGGCAALHAAMTAATMRPPKREPALKAPIMADFFAAAAAGEGLMSKPSGAIE
jgi:hypothetical protein